MRCHCGKTKANSVLDKSIIILLKLQKKRFRIKCERGKMKAKKEKKRTNKNQKQQQHQQQQHTKKEQINPYNSEHNENALQYTPFRGFDCDL